MCSSTFGAKCGRTRNLTIDSQTHLYATILQKERHISMASQRPKKLHRFRLMPSFAPFGVGLDLAFGERIRLCLQIDLGIGPSPDKFVYAGRGQEEHA